MRAPPYGPGDVLPARCYYADCPFMGKSWFRVSEHLRPTFNIRRRVRRLVSSSIAGELATYPAPQKTNVEISKTLYEFQLDAGTATIARP